MRHVALTIGDRFVHLVEDGERLVARADAEALEPSGAFVRVPLGHDRIALRTTDGRYLTIRPQGRMSFGLVAEPELSADAAFEEILWPGGEVSLRSSQLTYVTALLDGSVAVNRTLTGVGERFSFVPVPAAVVPGQVRRRVATAEQVLRSSR